MEVFKMNRRIVARKLLDIARELERMERPVRSSRIRRRLISRRSCRPRYRRAAAPKGHIPWKALEALWEKFVDENPNHPLTACYRYMKDKVDDARAYCRWLEGEITGKYKPTRGKGASRLSRLHRLYRRRRLYKKTWDDFKGVPAEEVKKWKKMGFSPESAWKWLKAGFAPEGAAAWIGHGFNIDEAKKYADEGYSPEEVEEEMEKKESLGRRVFRRYRRR